MVVFVVRKWEKITDVLNGIMDWASSLLGENESKSNSKKQSSPAVIEKSDAKKKLTFWQQLQRVSPYKKSIAFILCLPGFVGIGGLQRLYVRSWFTGIVYLLTGGLFGIGTIVDMVLIFTGNFRDSNNLYLESDARRNWDSKYAKWRYVYWSYAIGRYFVDATSIEVKDDLISCAYLVELNSSGKKPFEKMRLGSAEYAVQYVQFLRNGKAASVSIDRMEVLDRKGNVIYEETIGSPFELIEKDSMYECIYLSVIYSL